MQSVTSSLSETAADKRAAYSSRSSLKARASLLTAYFPGKPSYFEAFLSSPGKGD